jgi:probable rRNA maturation factor
VKFDKLIKRILKKEEVLGSINVILIGDKEIRELNRKFRGKDKATDVLAFPMGEEGILGDIAISTETARRNAKNFGVKYKGELKRLVIHGALHLLGYKHNKEMRHAEKVYQKL